LGLLADVDPNLGPAELIQISQEAERNGFES
jgi:hypothetical protein